MELVALTTAMGDARAAIQAGSRQLQECKRRILSQPGHVRREADQIALTQDACNDMLAVVQVHLTYLTHNDSLLAVPGTNTENSEVQMADYWALARLFERFLDNMNQSPNDIHYDDITEMIYSSLGPLQRKYATTLAGFGVEVWSWSVSNIHLSASDRDALRAEAQDFLVDAQHSTQMLMNALKKAEAHVLERLEELKEQQGRPWLRS